MANIMAHAPTPKINRKTEVPEEKGENRMVNGNLQYMNPMTATWGESPRVIVSL